MTGLARFCTEVYAPPDPKKGFGSEMAHLTNYSLNKTSEQFMHSNENPFSLDNAASNYYTGSTATSGCGLFS